MIKNGKYFIPPPKDGGDFKELFKRLASAGAGRPVDKDGFPQGPWTPDLLADAITKIDAKGSGVELRTVQLWFQDNDKGIGTENTRLLARIFGCDDPEATSDWQAVLGVARSGFVAKRREKRRTKGSDALEPLEAAHSAIRVDRAEAVQDTEATSQRRRFSLAGMTEALFSGSTLNLPTSIFAGAVALVFISYFLGIHDITSELPEDPTKQVGFFWAPNWMVVFVVLMPLFITFVAELLAYWKNNGRAQLEALCGRMDGRDSWTLNIKKSSYAFWSVFLICIFFAGVFQWISIRLLPLLRGRSDYPMDWGSIAIQRPDVITAPEAIGFTAIAYLYMCVCFYLFFAGFILLYAMAQDFRSVHVASSHTQAIRDRRQINEIAVNVLNGIFRCTLLGILIAICMKLQGAYLASSDANIAAWFFHDLASAFGASGETLTMTNHKAPNHFTSLLIVLITCFVFLHGVSRLNLGASMVFRWAKMVAVVALLVTSYALISAVPGFSILLSIGVFL
ncbi:MAG: hypothetical protein KDE63_11830, partial [Novosphingobium sp.]|nr:hypothetical protein [Novosphingobium sp.]